jgi:hypothetical protein
MAYCVLVKGVCRGKKCDYWGRVRIRKSSIEELAAGIKAVIIKCSDGTKALEDALIEYWFAIGIRDMKKLCEEEPDLCAKLKEAEVQAQI